MMLSEVTDSKLMKIIIFSFPKIVEVRTSSLLPTFVLDLTVVSLQNHNAADDGNVDVSLMNTSLHTRQS